MNTLKNKILETVKNNNIKMIPRWKFVLYSVLGLTGIAFVFLIAVFIFSLVLFVLSRHGFLSVSFFEFMGMMHAITTIPLFLVITSVVLIIIIELISRTYTFTFRKPLALTLLFITSLAGVISFVISLTPVHEYVRSYARNHGIHVLSRAYERPMQFMKNDGYTVIRGLVTSTTTNTVTLKLFDEKVVTCHAASTSKSTQPSLGEDVVMKGKFVKDGFEYIDIRNAPPQPFKGRKDDMRKSGGEIKSLMK